MKLVSKLLLIFFMLGLLSVCLPQKVLAVSDEGRASFKLYELKAKQGDADAQFNLALLYRHGAGTTHDHRNAIYWYIKAAQQGHVQAQYKLGSLYHSFRYEEEVPQDSNRAVYWLTKAAEQGYVHAQYKLGQIYESGDVAPQDYKQAFFWYTKAAEQGHYFAKKNRDKMLEMMSQSQEEQKEKAGQAAITRMEKEGLAREEAEGITSIQSFQLYQPKANQGDADAQFNLALLYNRGVGTPQDTKQAVYWYTKAAEQGRVNAQYNLGSLYQFDGSGGVPQDFKQAVYWYTKAAEQGQVNAQYNLGHMYEYGDEVPQDYKQAVYWYTKAAEQDHYFAKEKRDKMLEMMSQSQEEQKEKTRQAAIARMEREGLAREEAERREVERKRQAELARLERETKERLAKEEAERRENINRKWIPFLRTIEGNIWLKSRLIPCKLGKDLYVCLQNNDQDDITTENIKNKIIEAKQKEGRSVDLFYTHQIPKASSITVAIYFKVNGNTLNVNSKQTCSGIFCGDREDSLFTVSLPYNEGPF